MDDAGTCGSESTSRGRRVLVTGATRGIGRAVAVALAPDFEVVVVGRRAEDVAAVVESVRTETPGAAATGLLLDLADITSLAGACSELPDLDGVVHCAGVEGTASAADLEPEFLASVLAVNLNGPVELTRQLLPGLRRRRGRVVFVNSTAALQTFAGWGAYSASKAALRAYADTLRVEERPHGVGVTSVFPGRTDTGMQRDIAAKRGAEFDPTTAMSAASVAAAVRHALTAPADAEVTDLTITPGPRG
ncbi:short-subunit dehydrogenase [Georgenia soli]|uniref:Short-subunit dehydrogenase n=1 Tax=Georgenia soli TaxID=638953 RepID=A0A2A9EL75_9MICO|nr:SDR family oxidoreductase [Georgenia soli]PFG39658.1 short-subunit dehydrogenase [Georgenia soli]